MDRSEMGGKFSAEGEVETRFRRARQVWDDRIGSARQSAFVWRTVGLIALLLAGMMGLALIWRSTAADVVPYVIEVDQEGTVRLVGTPETQDWDPGEGVQQYFLRQWIHDVRSVSTDRSVIREQLERAYDGVSGRAANLLDEHVEEDNPFEMDDRTRTAEIDAVTRAGEEKSWRVEWVEKTRDAQGYLVKEERRVGIFELERIRPESVEDVEANALGLFVEYFSWSTKESE